MIQLHTLGEAVITVGDREVRPTSPTVFAALLYLGVERGQRVPRAALQALLFPESDERSGSHSLRQLLYKLRQLGAPVQTEGDVVWVDPGDVVDASVGNGAPANGKGHSSVAFLDGYAPRLSETFDEWLEEQRSSAGKAVRRSLLSRMAARRSAADWPAVEAIAQQILKVDAFNEEATLALAEATALSGAKAEALRILDRYESEVGRTELKLPASVLKRRISERLPERRPQKLDTPFVGRELETEAMRQAIGQLRQGVAGTVVIVGEPGIGKSRLLEEMSALAMLEGVNVQTVRCQPHHATRPMGVFIELVPALMQCRGALGVSPEMLEHLQLLTSHRDDRPNRPTDARDDATRAGILLAAVRDLVDAVSAEAPLLLAVEDAHWADPTSLRELSALVQGKARSLLLVHTARLLEPLKQAGALSDAVTLLRLKPLVDDSMASLAAHLLPEAVAANSATDVQSWCVNTAAGNPLYLQVLCAHYEETKQPFAVPPSMRAGIIRRIEQLPSDCRRLLEFSALLGRHASLDALRTLLELSPLAFVKAIQRLEGEGFIKTRDGAARLSHDLLTECTLELIPPLSLQALHACAAANLESRHEATGDAALLWDCAEHWAESGEASAALRFMMRCAAHASDLGRAGRATELLEGAKRFCRTSTESLAVVRKAMLTSRATGEWTVVFSQTRQLRVLCEALGLRLDLESELISLESTWFRDFSGASSVPRLLEIVGNSSTGDSDRVDAAYLALRIANESGDQGTAKLAFDGVEPLLAFNSRRLSDRLVPMVYHISFGDRTEGLSLARKLRDDLGDFDPSLRLRLASNTGLALGLMGAVSEARLVFDEYYRQAVALDLRAWSAEHATSCAWTSLCDRDFEGARHWHEIARGHGIGTSWNHRFLSNAAELAIHDRDPEALRHAIEHFPSPEEGPCPIRVRAFRRSLEVQLMLMEPDYHVSDDLIEELRSLFDGVKWLLAADAIVEALCLALERRGRREEGTRIAEEYVDAYRRELSPLTPALQSFVRAS